MGHSNKLRSDQTSQTIPSLAHWLRLNVQGNVGVLLRFKAGSDPAARPKQLLHVFPVPKGPLQSSYLRASHKLVYIHMELSSITACQTCELLLRLHAKATVSQVRLELLANTSLRASDDRHDSNPI